MSVGHTSTVPVTLTDQHVLALVERLEAEGRAVDVVRLTEKWGYGRSLPRAAMLAAARALLSLRLMDRALNRLRALTDASEDDTDALALTAELMLERGWAARGARTTERLRSLDASHARLPVLDALAAAPPQQLLTNARAIERSGSSEQLLRLAEVYLATGSLLRGKNLLERLRRKRPDDERVQQLLWAARGDLKPRPGPLANLVNELNSTPDDHAEEWEQADRTESATFSDVTMSGVLPPEPQLSTGFPRLFRQPGEEGAAAEPAEVTIAAHMASFSEMVEPPAEEVTESSMLDDDPDTRIMEIIPRDRGPQGAEREGRQAIDLRALHEQADPETDMGAEDDDLIVMKERREPVTRAPRPLSTPNRRRRPIEVVEKHPTPLATPPTAAPVPPPPGPISVPPPVEPPLLELEDDLEPMTSGPSPLLVMLSAAAVALIGVGGVYFGMRAQAGKQVTARTAGVLSEGDFGTLRALEVQLTQQVSSRQPPLRERATALALVESVLWAEYTGDIEDRQQALDAVSLARESGARDADLAVPLGTIALTAGELEEAARFAESATDSDESRYLAAQVALRVGSGDVAASIWPDPPPAGERYAALGAELAGPDTFTVEGASLEVQIIAHERRWGALEAAGRLDAVSSLQSNASRLLSPRQRSRLYAVAAELNEELGRGSLASVAWQQALRAGPAAPDVLYAVASREIVAGSASDAIPRLEQCRAVFPSEPRCQRALVVGLLELDRLDAAAAAAEGAPMLAAWVELARGGSPSLPDDDGGTGLRDYLQGLLAARASDTEAVEASMSIARVSLATSPYPELRALAPRALAVLVEHGHSRLASQRARELKTLGSTDPSVHVRLSRYYQSSRRSSDAAQYLSHATLLAEERDNAPALFALGELHREASQPALAEAQWRRYLALEPSGARAASATAALSP